MRIGGVQKVSLVDYPGKTSAVIFTVGCNMRCGYCHNPELVLPERYGDVIPVTDVLAFLATRVGKLEGVVVSGGEPTIHDDLPRLIASIKQLGFTVKLDTNGTHPDMLQQMYDDRLLDYVSMDIKGTPDSYQMIAAYPIDMDAIMHSIELIKNSGVDYEFRTTVVKSQIPVEDFKAIGEMLRGASRYALQKFRSGRTLSPAFRRETTYSDEEFEEIKNLMGQYVDYCLVR
jgi:pyruvate formate lyase activating enzyme